MGSDCSKLQFRQVLNDKSPSLVEVAETLRVVLSSY